jgi:hypothetical protein
MFSEAARLAKTSSICWLLPITSAAKSPDSIYLCNFRQVLQPQRTDAVNLVRIEHSKCDFGTRKALAPDIAAHTYEALIPSHSIVAAKPTWLKNPIPSSGIDRHHQAIA